VKRAVRLLRRAQADLQRLHDHLAEMAPLRADTFIDRLISAIEALESFPERGSVPRDDALRQRGYRFIVYADYLVFHKVLPRQVRVYRILYGGRAYRSLL
jgi:toxin ParE1/3/4